MLVVLCLHDLEVVDVEVVSVSVSQYRVLFSFDCLPALERNVRFLRGGLSFVIILLTL